MSKEAKPKAEQTEEMVSIPLHDFPTRCPDVRGLECGSIFRARRRVFQEIGGESLVVQADRASTNVNSIVEKWRKSGTIPLSGRTPRYGDFSGVGDYHGALERIRAAEAEFMGLPARVREACSNDPGVFLDKVFSDEGRKELEALGMPKDSAPPKADEPAPPAGS